MLTEKDFSTGAGRFATAGAVAVLFVLVVGTVIVGTSACRPMDAGTGPSPETITQCLTAGATTDAAPAGYVTTTRVYDTACPQVAGTPPPQVGNESTYTYIKDKPINALLDICTDQTVPTGWSPQPAEQSARCLDVYRTTFETSTTITCKQGCAAGQ